MACRIVGCSSKLFQVLVCRNRPVRITTRCISSNERNPEARISNHIVGSYLVAGCTKHRSRRECESACTRSCLLLYAARRTGKETEQGAPKRKTAASGMYFALRVFCFVPFVLLLRFRWESGSEAMSAGGVPQEKSHSRSDSPKPPDQ